MFLEQRLTHFSPPQFNPGIGNAANILGTTQQWQIDRTWPIEEILVSIGFTVTTALVWKTGAGNVTVNDYVDNILTILGRANLSINDRNQPRSVVDCSGIGLLEYVSQSGFNQDPSTMELVGYANSTGLPVGAYRINYRIPMVHPGIAEPLRSRMYLPAHKFLQDPVLKLTYNSQAQMGIAAGGVIGSVFTDIVLMRRLPTAQSEAFLAGSNDQANPNPYGYVDFDLIETPYAIAPGIGSEQRLALPTPGNYMSLTFRQYLGADPITRNVVDGSGIGDTTGRGFGAETLWRLESGGTVLRQWKWRHLQTINDWSRPAVTNGKALFVAAASAGAVTTPFNTAPNFGGNTIAATNFRPAASTQLNFVTDGLSGESGNELGSLLDCNMPANSGLKMEVIGTPAVPVTYASSVYVIGHRLFGGIGRWQKF